MAHLTLALSSGVRPGKQGCKLMGNAVFLGGLCRSHGRSTG
jgi:hypothetical protein